MHRLFGLLVLAAVGAGVYLLLAAPAPEPAETAAQAAPWAAAPWELLGGYSGWAIGVLMGVMLAWLARIDWAGLPERVRAWFSLQRRRLGWAMIGGALAAVLLLF